jgi:iron-sulfur cluster repair protein YtfE (RIC family)
VSTISDYMARDHSHCDELFAMVENLAAESKWIELKNAYGEFTSAMEKHFKKEESLLFPGLESQMQSPAGPTQVMRMEHEQMRELLANLTGWIANEDQGEILGEAETLLIMMQQHNMKEEQILYPMIDQMLGNDAISLIDSMEQI